MEEPVRIKLEPLNAEAFAPYGQVLESKQPIFPEVEPGEGRVAMEIIKAKRPANARRLEQLAIHFSYNQTFIPLHGALVLVVAPAPSNRSAGQEKYEVNYSKLKAFLVEVGQAAFIDKGVWHNAITPGTECTFINVTRKNPGEGTTQSIEPGRVEEVPKTRPYVEFVDLKKRDGRFIELEL
jgi:ureidoglycolate hydrolase